MNGGFEKLGRWPRRLSFPEVTGKTKTQVLSSVTFEAKKKRDSGVFTRWTGVRLEPMKCRRTAGICLSFAEHDAQVVGISPDSIYKPPRMAGRNPLAGWNIHFLSDYWPHAGVAQQFGILRLGRNRCPELMTGPSSSWTNRGKIVFSKTL